jgi:hypothetical protein
MQWSMDRAASRAQSRAPPPAREERFKEVSLFGKRVLATLVDPPVVSPA